MYMYMFIYKYMNNGSSMGHPITVASKENDRKLNQKFIADDNNPFP